jgi:hypothetical protein
VKAVAMIQELRKGAINCGRALPSWRAGRGQGGSGAARGDQDRIEGILASLEALE